MARKTIPRFDDIGLESFGEDTAATASVATVVSSNGASNGELLHLPAFTQQGWRGAEPESVEQTALIRRVWGDAILASPTKVTAIVRAQSVMAEESGNMLNSALSIGRSLVELKAILSPEEFARGLRRSAEAFRGWSSGNISKIMRVAEFVQHAKVALTVLPQSYTTLYELTTLNDAQLERAKSLALFRPDVRRSDIVEFKKRVREGISDDEVGSPQLVKIEEKIRRLQAELSQARRERTKIVAQSGRDKGRMLAG